MIMLMHILYKIYIVIKNLLNYVFVCFDISLLLNIKLLVQPLYTKTAIAPVVWFSILLQFAPVLKHIWYN